MGKNTLQNRGIVHAFHVTPLHYVPFILRSGCLFSKDTLLKKGYNFKHFRATSHRADLSRGFGQYVHLTNLSSPPILTAKLAKGIPHVLLRFDTGSFRETQYHLCRFNIAKGRYLRKDGKPGLSESQRNGSYLKSMQIPIASTVVMKKGLLSNLETGRMLEILQNHSVDLADSMQLTFFSKEDYELLKSFLLQEYPKLDVSIRSYQNYPLVDHLRTSVTKFLTKSILDRTWKGNGLNFD